MTASTVHVISPISNMAVTSGNPDKTPVAKDIFTYCTREKIETWHIVRNHGASGIVDRVICKACGSDHKYRKKMAAAAPAKSGSRAIVRSAGSPVSSTSSSEALSASWFSGIKKWGSKPVPEYAASQLFQLGEVFTHPTFGKGVVQGRRDGNKIDVLFQDQIRVLKSG